MNNLSHLLSGLSNYYSWLDGYTKMVLFEYEKFMLLHKKYDEICPSDDVEKCWQYHIMDTQTYSLFCDAICGKMIHYSIKLNSDIVIDRNKKNEMMKKCRKCYCDEYGAFKYDIVWSSTLCRTIYHLKSNSITLNFKFKKDKPKEIFIPDVNETFGLLKQRLSTVFSRDPSQFFIFIAGKQMELMEFTVMKIMQQHNLKYMNNYGYVQENIKLSTDTQLYDSLLIMRFITENINNFDIYLSAPK
jgi:hypothetical protein